jgi:hypothetical protein
MRIEALGVPHGQTSSVDYAIKGSLQVKMRDILQGSDLAELKSHSSRRCQLGESENTPFFI